ncbi:outer membrane protein [Phreatobacter aquaticus]|nr:outer membrane protein [Phreatobacter aquaticus]
MNRLLLAATSALALSTGFAQAADLGSRRAPVASAVVMPAFSWTGFYIGGQIGGAWMNNSTREFVTATGVATGFQQAFRANGLIGGIHGGYNYQINNFVLGLEADLEAAGVSGGYRLANGNGTRFRDNWQGSVRARAGVAVDRALFYVTGGVAFAQMRHSYFTAAVTESFSQTRAGWTLGAGVEYALAANWTARLEYRYSDFGRANYVNAVAFPGFTYRQNPNEHAVRVGVSYLFSTGPSAVVARY